MKILAYTNEDLKELLSEVYWEGTEDYKIDVPRGRNVPEHIAKKLNDFTKRMEGKREIIIK